MQYGERENRTKKKKKKKNCTMVIKSGGPTSKTATLFVVGGILLGIGAAVGYPYLNRDSYRSMQSEVRPVEWKQNRFAEADQRELPQWKDPFNDRDKTDK
jgi:hypothetical protein